MSDERDDTSSGQPEVSPERGIVDISEEFLSAEAAGVPGPEPEVAGGSSQAEAPQSEAADVEVPATGEPIPGAAVQSATMRYSQAQLLRARDLLARLSAVRRAARFYPLDHPAITEGTEMLSEVLRAYHGEGVDVHLAFFEGEILLGEQLLTEESLMFDQLVRDVTGVGIGSIIFVRGMESDELTRAMQVIAADSQTVDEAGGVEAITAHLGLTHISIGTMQVVERLDATRASTAEEAKAAYGGAVSLLREIDRLMRANRHMSTSKVKGVVRSLVDNVLSNRYAMLQLTGLKNYDEYTFYHSANVAILSLALGSMITTDYRFLSSLGVGALLHDIGKLSVDLDILNKPGALSPDEWSSVREHPVHGAQMVSLLPGVDKAAVVIILEHHMRFDGTGYPTRTPSRRQHLASRIVAVADSYDAMTSRRSYSAARVQDEAMALLVKSADSSLDPVLVRLFVRLMGVYPSRSVVRLSSGQVGIVLQPSPHDPVRPLVRVIASQTGDFTEPTDVDLATAPALSIRGCIDPKLLNIDVDAYV